MKRKSILVVFLILSTLLASCNSSYDCNENDRTDAAEACFSSKNTRMSCSNCVPLDVFDFGDSIGVVVLTKEENQINNTVLVKYDKKTMEQVSYVILADSDSLDYCLLDSDRIVGSTYEGFNIYSTIDGSIIDSCSDYYYTYGDFPRVDLCDGGFVLATTSNLKHFDSMGEMIGEISFDDLIIGNAEEVRFLEKDNNDYLLADCFGEMSYYSVDLETGVIEKQFGSNDIDLEYGAAYNFDGFAKDSFNGVLYEIDFKNQQMIPCAYTNNMLVIPQTKVSGFDPMFFFLNDREYVELYRYEDGVVDVVYIYEDPDLDLLGREKIIVRGFNTTYDTSLLLARYLYNTSQDQYNLCIEEYGPEYAYSTIEEAQLSTMRLIQDINNGDVPDIYYGPGFDYQYWGENGLVIDMADYVSDSSLISPDTIIEPAYRLFFDDNSHCYQLFGGFSMFGFWSKTSMIDNNQVTFDEFISNNKASRHLRSYYAFDIADFFIRYPIKELTRNNSFISVDELRDIVAFAIDNGVGPDGITGNNESFSQLANNELLAVLSYCGGIEDFDWARKNARDSIVFIGFPSVGCDVNPIYPYDYVAISSSSQSPDACFDFIELLFSDDVQQLLIESGYSVVRNDIVRINDNITTETNENYNECVSRIDTVMSYDWGISTIIREEINSYYLQGKTIDEITESLHNRLQLYVNENY